jgi:hypothetical protein
MKNATKFKAAVKSPAILMKTLVCLVIIYILGWFILFDRSQPSYLFDVEYSDGKKVVAGPLPREWAARPPYHGSFFVGNEWPFTLYSYFCKKWAEAHGYSTFS